MRKSAALLLVSVLLFVMSACGGNTNDTPAPVSDANVQQTAQETPTETKKSGETAKITISFPLNYKASYKQFVERFNDAHDDVKIEPLWGGDQVSLIAANKAPDIIFTGDLYVEAHKDILLDLEPYIAKDSEEVNMGDFFPQVLDPLKYDGKQLAMPADFNVGLLYYNKKLFDEAKVPYPTADWTIEQFIDAGQKLTKRDDKNKVTQWGSSTVFGWWGEWLIHVRQAGGDFMKDGKVTLDTPEAINGLRLFLDKTTKGAYKFSPGPKDDPLGGFGGQKTAMEYGGHTGLWIGYNQIPGFDWDIEVLPKGLMRSEGGEMALEAYGIYNKTKYPDAAWEVLKFITGAAGSELLVDLGKTTVRKSVADKTLQVPKEERQNPKNLEALYKMLDNGMVLPRNKEFINMAIQVVQPYIDKMLEGKLAPEEVGNQATKAAQEYLDTQAGK